MNNIKHLLLLLAASSLSWLSLQAQSSCDGGTVQTTDSLNQVYTCAEDGIEDVLEFEHQTTTPTANYAYVITDEDGIILGLPSGNSQNFEPAGPGICLVWGLAYTGTLTAQVGDDATTAALSDDCFDLSDNSITVNRDVPDGGHVMTVNGDTTVYTCPGDAMADVIEFMHQTDANSNYAYVITDEDGNILGLPPGNSQNFEGAGEGTCLVWGLSYTGNLIAQPGDNALEVALTDECFDLSDNFISVIRDVPEGGTVSTTNGMTEVTTCAGDGMDDVISFMHETSSNSAYAYVVTDADGNILGLPPGNEVNFEPAGPGTCLVWGLSYTGNLTAQLGDNALEVALTDGCFELSENFITVERTEVDGGTVATAGGMTEVTTCANDGEEDVISFMHETDSDANYAYVVTDADGNILGLPPGNEVNFESAGPGTCLVWGLSYTGNLTAQLGDNALEVALTDGCFELSENFITVERNTECVISFTLVNADTDQDLMPLTDGEVVDLSSLGLSDPRRLNIRANLVGAIPGSVVFSFDDEVEFSIEQIFPYALGGDDDGDYHPTGSAMSFGEHTLTVTPYSSYQGMGTAGTAATISFTIVPGSGANRRAAAFGLQVYPNPVQHQLTLEMPEGRAGQVQLDLMNAVGRVVSQEQFDVQGPNWRHRLAMDALPAGVYILRVVNEGLVKTARLVKE